MIRGVNKNVIEISDTGNDCFERAILFVRADTDSAKHDGEQLKHRAKEYLAGLKLRPRFYSRGKLWRLLFKLSIAAAIGGGITAFMLIR